MSIYRDSFSIPQASTMRLGAGGVKGVFEPLSPVERALSQVSYAKNFIRDGGTAIITRPGRAPLAAAATVSGTPQGLAAYYPTDAESSLVLAQNGSVYLLDSAAAWTEIASGLSTTANMQACQFNDELILTNGVDTALVSSGSTASTMSEDAPLSPFCLSAYSRIFFVELPHWLWCCDIEDYETWLDPDAATIPINEKDGDQITWLALYRSQVVIFKRHSLYELHGPELGKTTDDWEIMRAGSVGTPNGRTVQEIDGVLFWLSDDGVVAYAGGDARVISAPVQDTIDLINWSAIATACAGRDSSGRYLLSIPINSDTYPTVTLVYNTRDDSWWRWEGWNPTCWERYRLSSREQLVLADQSGIAFQVTGTTDSGAGIATEVVFGPSALGLSANDKVLGDAHFVVSAASGATLVASIALNDVATTYGTAVSIVPTGTTGAVGRVRKQLPMASGEGIDTFAPKVKIVGSGVVSVHDIALDYEGRESQ